MSHTKALLILLLLVQLPLLAVIGMVLFVKALRLRPEQRGLPKARLGEAFGPRLWFAARIVFLTTTVTLAAFKLSH